MNTTRDFEGILLERLKEKLNFIQVLIGPRQVGKTTGVKNIFSKFKGPKHFASADSPIPYPAEWISSQWKTARALGPGTLLVIDEIQKVSGWAETCKLLFDEDRPRRDLKIVLLGSASLSLQDGLTASLSGRFELIKATHWSPSEFKKAFNWNLDKFLSFGGYPAAAELTSDFERWRSFIRDSIIEPVLGRDISGLVNIGKPALFRQTFQLSMGYPAQVVSYSKLLGQLQDRGNAATIKHYLELFEGAFLIRRLEKFSVSKVSAVSSSPKIIPLAPALVNGFIDSASTLKDASWRGRLFESMVISQLIKLPGTFYYWSEGNHEVDLVRVIDKKVIAYEIKSGLSFKAKSLEIFKARNPKVEIRILDRETVEKWLENPKQLEP